MSFSLTKTIPSTSGLSSLTATNLSPFSVLLLTSYFLYSSYLKYLKIIFKAEADMMTRSATTTIIISLFYVFFWRSFHLISFVYPYPIFVISFYYFGYILKTISLYTLCTNAITCVSNEYNNNAMNMIMNIATNVHISVISVFPNV